MKIRCLGIAILLTIAAFNESLLRAEQISSAFTPGNIVVYRTGTGASGLTSAATQIYLDEYTPAGVLVQSILVPNAGANQLTDSGVATSDGALTRSADGQYLVFTGYRAAIGTASVAGSSAATYPRTVALLDASGNMTSRTLGSTVFNTNNIRSAATVDGSTIYAIGGNGVYNVPFIGTGETQIATNNTRQANIFGDRLYVSSSSGTNTFKGVDTFTSAFPTSAETATRLTGLTDTANPSTYSFFMADLDPNTPGLDTLYCADDTATTGGIQKYSLVGGTWVSNGIITAATAVRGLTGVVNGTTVSLFGTTGGSGAAGGGAIYSITDTAGYDAAIDGSLTTIATAGSNEAFRGVALAPVPEPSTLALLLAGGFGLAAFAYRRMK